MRYILLSLFLTTTFLSIYAPPKRAKPRDPQPDQRNNQAAWLNGRHVVHRATISACKDGDIARLLRIIRTYPNIAFTVKTEPSRNSYVYGDTIAMIATYSKAPYASNVLLAIQGEQERATPIPPLPIHGLKSKKNNGCFILRAREAKKKLSADVPPYQPKRDEASIKQRAK